MRHERRHHPALHVRCAAAIHRLSAISAPNGSRSILRGLDGHRVDMAVKDRANDLRPSL